MSFYNRSALPLRRLCAGLSGSLQPCPVDLLSNLERSTEQQQEQAGDASGMLRAARVHPDGGVPTSSDPSSRVIRAPCWLFLMDSCQPWKRTEDVQQGFSLTHGALGRTLTCLRYRKWHLWETGDPLKDHTTPAGQGLQMPHTRLAWEQVRAAEKMKNLQGYGGMWFSPLRDTPKALCQLPLPSAASLVFFPWHKYSSQAETPSLHTAWHRLSFNCPILYVIAPFKMLFGLPSSHPRPLLSIQLTSWERQGSVGAGDSGVKCISSTAAVCRCHAEQSTMVRGTWWGAG